MTERDFQTVRCDLDDVFSLLANPALETHERAKLLHRLQDLLIEADRFNPPENN